MQRGAPTRPIRVHLYLMRFPPLVRDRSVCTHEVDGRLLEGFPFIRTRVSVCEPTGDEGRSLAGERGRPAIAYRLREVKDYVLIKGRILNYIRETLESPRE